MEFVVMIHRERIYDYSPFYSESKQQRERDVSRNRYKAKKILTGFITCRKPSKFNTVADSYVYTVC